MRRIQEFDFGRENIVVERILRALEAQYMKNDSGDHDTALMPSEFSEVHTENPSASENPLKSQQPLSKERPSHVSIMPPEGPLEQSTFKGNLLVILIGIGAGFLVWKYFG